MFYILRKTTLYRRYLLSFLFMIPLLLPNFLVASHAPALLEQAQTERHLQLDSVNAEVGHSHSDGLTHEKTVGHTHGHNSGDHQHGSVLVVDNQLLLINASFAQNTISLTPYYPPHLTLPDQPPRILS